MTEREPLAPSGVGGWLLVLCLLLLVWQPLSLALVAANLDAVVVRGLPVALMLTGRLLVAAFGIAAGIALLGRRAAAVTMAKAALVLSAATDAFVYLTPYYPNNRLPGDEWIALAISVVYSAVWLGYLFRSKRVRNTYS